MKHTIYPSLTLATLVLACAHDPANHHAGNVANAEQRAEARSDGEEARAENRAENRAERDGQRIEPVEMPQRGADRGRVASSDTTVPVATGVASEPTTGHAPNNTGINERDRGSEKLTPMDQGNSEVDIDLTQRIRKAVMADDSLSFSAKNTKIITRDGRVTLRGPVKTAAEKDAIYKCAVSAAGVGHVTNELEVESK
jgi:hyperosmotically inducible periplasmic protein